MRRIIMTALGVAAFLPAGADAAGTGFDPRVIVVGEARDQLKFTAALPGKIRVVPNRGVCDSSRLAPARTLAGFIQSRTARSLDSCVR